MNHPDAYLAGHGNSMQMQLPQHPQHMQSHHHAHQHHQHHHHMQQQYHHHHLQIPQQPPSPQLVESTAQDLKPLNLMDVRPKSAEEQEKGKGGAVLQQKEYAKLRENFLKQRFSMIVLQRQLHVANSRLNCALEGLRLAKDNKPFHKYYVQAMDEKRHFKSVSKTKSNGKDDELDDQEMDKKQSKDDEDKYGQTKMVTTKKGDRQRPFKYSTRSKDEMIVISCAADAVVAGTASLREAKDALREMGIYHFETSLSNKMYNHPDKKYYLKMRKDRREEKKVESSKKSEARITRKKNKEREHEMKEQKKRQKRQKKSPQPMPMIHEIQPGPHMAYGHPHLQHPGVPQMAHFPHDLHRL